MSLISWGRCQTSTGPVAQWIRHRPTEPGIAASSPAGVMFVLRHGAGESFGEERLDGRAMRPSRSTSVVTHIKGSVTPASEHAWGFQEILAF